MCPYCWTGRSFESDILRVTLVELLRSSIRVVGVVGGWGQPWTGVDGYGYHYDVSITLELHYNITVHRHDRAIVRSGILAQKLLGGRNRWTLYNIIVLLCSYLVIL